MNKYAEYASLRDEARYSDDVCVKILGFLLAASASIYGFAIEGQAHRLLVISTALWLVGFFYIAEKRFTIKRIGYYLRTKVESPELALSWQTWQRDPEADPSAKENFLRFSPFKLEFSLLLFISFVNAAWLWVAFLQNPEYASWDFLVAIFGSLGFLAALIGGGIVMRKYYRKARFL